MILKAMLTSLAPLASLASSSLLAPKKTLSFVGTAGIADGIGTAGSMVTADFLVTVGIAGIDGLHHRITALLVLCMWVSIALLESLAKLILAT